MVNRLLIGQDHKETRLERITAAVLHQHRNGTLYNRHLLYMKSVFDTKQVTFQWGRAFSLFLTDQFLPNGNFNLSWSQLYMSERWHTVLNSNCIYKMHVLHLHNGLICRLDQSQIPKSGALLLWNTTSSVKEKTKMYYCIKLKTSRTAFSSSITRNLQSEDTQKCELRWEGPGIPMTIPLSLL